MKVSPWIVVVCAPCDAAPPEGEALTEPHTAVEEDHHERLYLKPLFSGCLDQPGELLGIADRVLAHSGGGSTTLLRAAATGEDQPARFPVYTLVLSKDRPGAAADRAARSTPPPFGFGEGRP